MMCSDAKDPMSPSNSGTVSHRSGDTALISRPSPVVHAGGSTRSRPRAVREVRRDVPLVG